MNTSIIILAQQLESIKKCLMDIEIRTEPPYEIIVVYDGVDTELAAWLQNKAGIRRVITNKPLGVASGYNLGASEANGKNVVFMRDYIHVTEAWLPRLLQCLEADGQSAIAGPVSNGVSGFQCVPYDCGELRDVQQTARAVAAAHAGKAKKVSRLLSFLMAVRKDAFVRLGGFDEQFDPEGYEDDDLCYRALREGYRLYMAEDCFVYRNQAAELYNANSGLYYEFLASNKHKAFAKWGLDLTDALAAWGYPVTVSLCMIVKNEEQTLGRLLDSVAHLVDEVVIVDTGSTDRTKEIAASYNCRIFDFEWVNDFAKARNYAFSQATQEYLLWLDADDVLLEEDGERFKALKSSLRPDIDYVSMPYNLGEDGHGNVTVSLRRNRLVRRDKSFQWIGMVHEYLAVHGEGHHSSVAVTHRRIHTNSRRNLTIFEARETEGSAFSSRDLYYYANELSDNGIWERAVEKYQRFLARPDGWVEDKINACARCADALHHLGKTEEAKAAALQAFAYSQPRAELCCRLGHYHMMEEDYEQAIAWYTQATLLPRPADPMAMQINSYWTWLPHLQLCVCYDRTGRLELARHHNEMAAKHIPDDSRVAANRRYFAIKLVENATLV